MDHTLDHAPAQNTDRELPSEERLEVSSLQGPGGGGGDNKENAGVHDEERPRKPSPPPQQQRQQQQEEPGRNAPFTCLSCRVAFTTPAGQREHYRTDWHRYNLKRKVAELAPVSAEDFARKVLAQRAANQAAEANPGFNTECAVCKRVYSTENSFKNHLLSKRHKDAAARSAGSPSPDAPLCSRPLPKTTEQARGLGPLRVTDDMTEEEVNAFIDRRIESAPRLKPEDCLFCPARCASFEENMEHMTLVHSLFIPDMEYISDLRGLVRHLGEKITVANVCLLCNGRGRGFHSLEAVRDHMVDKSHCRIAYDTEEEQMELAQFYDFSTSYPDAGASGSDKEDSEGEGLLECKGAVAVQNLESELVLASGVRLGHRSLRRYYRQHFRPAETRDSVIINRLLIHYAESQSHHLARIAGGGKTALVTAAHRSGMLGKAAQVKAEQRAQRLRQVDFVTKVSFRNNNQKHFRDELLQ